MPVYVIAAGETGKVKIGWTETSADDRRASLQTAHWETLRVIRIIPGPFSLEARLHWFFASDCIRGEWFMLNDEMLTIEAHDPRLSEFERPDAAYYAVRLGVEKLAHVKKLAAIDDRSVSNMIVRLVSEAIAARGNAGLRALPFTPCDDCPGPDSCTARRACSARVAA